MQGWEAEKGERILKRVCLKMFEFSKVTAVQVRLCFLPFLQSWDAALAKTAKAWAKKCKFEHNSYLKVARKVHPTFTPVGENIWTGTATIFSVDAALSDWFNEVSSYDFNTNSCTGMCGHYTQVSLTCPMVYNVMVSQKVQGLGTDCFGTGITAGVFTPQFIAT